MPEAEPFEEFEEYKRWIRGLKPGSVNQYKSAMKLYMQFTGLNPKQLIDEAEVDFKKPRRERGKPQERLQDFYKWLTTEYKPARGRNARRGKLGISPYKARAIVGYLKAFYDRNGYPIGSLRLPSVAPRKENARIELSPQDVKRMVEVAPTKRDRALILFAYQGGFDRDTVVKLDLGDFPDKVLQKLLNNEMPDTPVLLHVVREKEGIDYHTCLGYDAINAFRAYLNERRLRGEELTLDSPAFVKEYTKGEKRIERMDKVLISQMMRTVALKAGVITRERLERADINPAGYHALRATFSRRLEYAGMPPAYIDYMQGHALPHGGAYRKPNPKKLLEKYKEFEHVLSITEAPKTLTEIEENLRRELEKERAYTRALEERIAKLEEQMKVLAETKNLLSEIKAIKLAAEAKKAE